MRSPYPRTLLACALGALALLPGIAFGQIIYFGSKPWPINDPFAAPGSEQNPTKGIVRNGEVTITEQVGSAKASITKRLSEATMIDWGERPKAMQLAEQEVLRGDGARALEYIEPILRFFSPVKKTTGSLWLPAASIKLDALILLKNDAVLDEFIDELAPLNDGSIPGLENKITLVRIEQSIRRGHAEAALADVDKMINETVQLDMIANLHLLKGNALLGLTRYEEAMGTFLRIPVFYGSQSKYMPAALLGAAKSFRGMNTPANRLLQLDDVTNGYLTEIITTYPFSKEAVEAKKMLPKELREALDKKNAEDSDVETAVVAIVNEDEPSGEN